MRIVEKWISSTLVLKSRNLIRVRKITIGLFLFLVSMTIFKNSYPCAHNFWKEVTSATSHIFYTLKSRPDSSFLSIGTKFMRGLYKNFLQTKKKGGKKEKMYGGARELRNQAWLRHTSRKKIHQQRLYSLVCMSMCIHELLSQFLHQFFLQLFLIAYHQTLRKLLDFPTN